MMSKHKLINNISGWIVFAISATVYLLTIEPTASFWDCGEFITSAYKLEVGHPPGAPFFMLVGNFFTQLARDTSQVAMMVNIMSALMSAFTILFLFWTITHLTSKLIIKDKGDAPSLAKTIVIIAAPIERYKKYCNGDFFILMRIINLTNYWATNVHWPAKVQKKGHVINIPVKNS